MESVLLTRPGPDVPWGFRLNGGTDQQKPLTVQRVTPGSVAAHRLIVGDQVVRIGTSDATTLSYAAAMELIKNSGDRLELYTARAGQSIQESSSITPPSYITNDVTSGFNDVERGHSQQAPMGHGEGYPEYDSRGPESLSSSQPRRAAGATVPDAVLNMAARTSQDKRPWTYAPDFQSLEQQRRRVQRRNYVPARAAPPAPMYTDPPRSPQVLRSRPLPQSTSQTQDVELENGTEITYKPIYGGPEIPSRTFQLLQSYTSGLNEPGITDLARAAQRRQKRREKLHSVSTPSHQSSRIERSEGEEEGRNDDKPFDERAYLAGRIPLVKGGPVDPTLFDLPSSNGRPEGREESDERDDENKKPFDERAYLAGRIPLVRGGTIDPTQFNVPERPVVKKYKEVNRPRLKQPFSEREYLAGKLNILGQTSERPRNVPPDLPSGGSRRTDAKPSWYKRDEDMVSEDEYDEESFLRGKFPIVRRSVDRELPPRKGVLDRSKYLRQMASWEKENQEEEGGRGGTCSETEFDERAFLAGRSGKRHVTDKEYSTDTEADLPSKTLRFLRRSESSDRPMGDDSGWRSSSDGGMSGDDAGSDQEKPYDYYMYQGRNIPSKIFSRLKKTMDRKAAAEKSKTRPSDPIERLKEKSLENLGIDVETAMERLEIGKHDPDTYMEILKQSVEANQSSIRIEPENEVTDF